MQKRKVITPTQRAQQTVLRLQALALSEAYKAKIARDRTIAIRKAVKEMAKYPPETGKEWQTITSSRSQS